MNPSLRKALAERFSQCFDSADLDTAEEPVLDPSCHAALALALRDDFGFTMYVTVAATHFQDKDGDRFEVATVLRKPGPGTETFGWCCKLPGSDPHIDSLVSVFAGADWQEREQYDLVGVRFDNHPDMRRLMMPDDWEGHPLRKDYAINKPHAPWR